jgi:hypothetical protein
MTNLNIGTPADVLVLAGKGSNLNSRANVALSASQVASAIFPLSRLADDRPSQRFIFPALQADDFISTELQLIANGQFTSWVDGEPADFTVTLTGSGTITQESVSPVVTGSSAECANGASGNVEFAQVVAVESGDELQLRVYTQTSNSDSPATLEIRNLLTGQYLDSSGFWVEYKTNCVANTATSLTQTTLDFTVESYALCQADEVFLQVRGHMDTSVASRTFWYDDLFIVPRASLVSFHSHNISPLIKVRVSSAEFDLTSSIPVDGAIDFPGTAGNYMILNENLTGVLDNKEGALSVYFTVDGGAAAERNLLTGEGPSTDSVRLFIDTADKVNFILKNSGGTPVLELESTVTVTADGAWHHLYITWDLLNTTADLYLDGVDRKSEVTNSNDTPYLTALNEWTVGADSSQASRWNGKAADLWMNIGTYLPAATNLTKFRTAGAYRADVGTDGELPLSGSNPNLFMPMGDSENQGANLGSGQTFTVTGTLGQAIQLHGEAFPTSPAFYLASDTPEYARFWRARFQGTNYPESISVGQWVIGDPVMLLRNPSQPDFERLTALSQQQLETAFVKERWSVKKERLERSGYNLRFVQDDDAQRLYEEELYKRSDYGGLGLVFIPSNQEAAVIHCKVRRNEILVKHRTSEITAVDLELIESSHGVVSE